MLLTVTHDANPDYQGSVTLVTGYDKDGKSHRFGVDTRIAHDLLGVVAVEGEITVQVEDWQLLKEKKAR